MHCSDAVVCSYSIEVKDACCSLQLQKSYRCHVHFVVCVQLLQSFMCICSCMQLQQGYKCTIYSAICILHIFWFATAALQIATDCTVCRVRSLQLWGRCIPARTASSKLNHTIYIDLHQHRQYTVSLFCDNHFCQLISFGRLVYLQRHINNGPFLQRRILFLYAVLFSFFYFYLVIFSGHIYECCQGS